ncbi:hypothetical protein [Sinomonas halotolerans]|uniref:Uncharacterized protein n=1 Tax=Sinomonas halotolerans TaxID=1644133 RepID=A0ABU9X2Q1_9MICC
MVRFRKASKPGVTVKYVGGRFTVSLRGETLDVAVEREPHGETEIMEALQRLLKCY